jgi:hypothetical protein
VSYPQGVEPLHNCFGLATGLGIFVIGGPFSHENRPREAAAKQDATFYPEEQPQFTSNVSPSW